MGHLENSGHLCTCKKKKRNKTDFTIKDSGLHHTPCPKDIITNDEIRDREGAGGTKLNLPRLNHPPPDNHFEGVV